MYTAETLSGVINVFSGQVDAKVKSGAPNAGQHSSKVVNGFRTEQRYVNGDTDIGRMSATVIERYSGDDLVLQHFTLSNHQVWAGEDAPKSEELDEAFTYKLYVNAIDGHAGAELHTADNAGFKAHMNAFDSLPPDDEEAWLRHMEHDDDFSIERALEPGEVESIGYLLMQVVSS